MIHSSTMVWMALTNTQDDLDAKHYLVCLGDGRWNDYGFSFFPLKEEVPRMPQNMVDGAWCPSVRGTAMSMSLSSLACKAPFPPS